MYNSVIKGTKETNHTKGGKDMTKRQKALGVTEYGYQRGIKEGEFLADGEAFLAKIATVKKGQYIALDITKQWCGELCAEIIHEYNVKPFLHGLTVNMPDHFYYTDTCGLDCLTVK